MNNYPFLVKQIEMLLDKSDKEISKLANASALLYTELNDVSWVGFYLIEKDYLYLGPFQGKVACTNIPINKGVCGKCAREKKTILVKNVHEFEGHIACDSASNSEIVIPLFKNNVLYAVLDIDSTSLKRFTLEDQVGLENIARAIERSL